MSADGAVRMELAGRWLGDPRPTHLSRPCRHLPGFRLSNALRQHYSMRSRTPSAGAHCRNTPRELRNGAVGVTRGCAELTARRDRGGEARTRSESGGPAAEPRPQAEAATALAMPPTSCAGQSRTTTAVSKPLGVSDHACSAIRRPSDFKREHRPVEILRPSASRSLHFAPAPSRVRRTRTHQPLDRRTERRGEVAVRGCGSLMPTARGRRRSRRAWRAAVRSGASDLPRG